VAAYALEPVAMTGAELPGIALPPCCPGCGVVLQAPGLARQAYVCDCGRHFPMSADAWMALVADAGTWRERWADLRPRDVLGWTKPVSYRRLLEDAEARNINEAVRTGTCTLGGRPIWLAVFDFRFVGGTLASVPGERLTRMVESARRQSLPVVVVTASGGARMQEGVYALVQMAKVNAALSAFADARLPYLSVLSHPTYGGTAASLALIADVTIAEPGAAIGFTGPRLIRQTTHDDLPAGFQTAEFMLAHGQVDMVVPRTELRATLALLHDLLR